MPNLSELPAMWPIYSPRDLARAKQSQSRAGDCLLVNGDRDLLLATCALADNFDVACYYHDADRLVARVPRLTSQIKQVAWLIDPRAGRTPRQQQLTTTALALAVAEVAASSERQVALAPLVVSKAQVQTLAGQVRDWLVPLHRNEQTFTFFYRTAWSSIEPIKRYDPLARVWAMVQPTEGRFATTLSVLAELAEHDALDGYVVWEDAPNANVIYDFLDGVRELEAAEMPQ